MSNHKMIGLLNHFFLVDIQNQLISEHILPLIGINAEEIPQLINPLPSMQYYANFVVPRDIYYFTLPQIYELFAKAPKRKFLDEILNVINTRVLPLLEDAKPKIKINPNKETEPLTMSSQEIADVVKSRHDDVKRSMERLKNKGLISFTPMAENPNIKGGRPKTVYHVNKRDSYIVVAQLSPEFTADLVDRWQELEKQVAQITPPIQEVKFITTDRPQINNYAAALTTLGIPQEIVPAIAKVYTERDEAWRTKQQISTKREASVMGKLAQAKNKIRRLEANMLPENNNIGYTLHQLAKKLEVEPLLLSQVVIRLGLNGNNAFGDVRDVSIKNNQIERAFFFNNLAIQLIKKEINEVKGNEK